MGIILYLDGLQYEKKISSLLGLGKDSLKWFLSVAPELAI